MVLYLTLDIISSETMMTKSEKMRMPVLVCGCVLPKINTMEQMAKEAVGIGTPIKILAGKALASFKIL